VTGASTGLGRAFAEMLLADGVRVWGTSRNVTRFDGWEARYPGRFTPVALDLEDGAAAERIFLACDAQADGLDLIINNAGYGAFGEFGDTDFAVWSRQVTVMLTHTAQLAHVALRQMRSRAAGGRRAAIVNISSLAAEFPLPYQSAYNICKAGLTALSESLMIECAGTHVVILDVRPGDYRTDFETSVARPPQRVPDARRDRAWRAFERMMRSGPAPAHAAANLRRALLRGKSGTLRTGRWFQAVIAPLLARFGSLGLKRRIQASYFDLS